LRSLFAPDPSNLNHFPTAELATCQKIGDQQMIEKWKTYRIVEFGDKGHDAESYNLNVGGKNRKKLRLLFIFTWLRAMIRSLGNNSGTINNSVWG
jgi:hypothetical protein